MSQWVQHISGQGEKWKVQSQYDLTVTDYWVVHNHSTEYRSALHLPKSEYRLCDPPEQWVDVTAEMTEDEVRCEIERWPHSYRLRKVRLFGGWSQLGDDPSETRRPIQGSEQWAFIVEKQVQP